MRQGFTEELCQKQVIDSCNTAKRCENHVFSPAYRKTQTDELFKICDHAVFNLFPSGQRTGEPRCGLASRAGRASILSARHKNMQL